MNIKYIFAVIAVCLPFVTTAATTPVTRIFSTSTDWSALTGIPMSRHDVKFVNTTKTVANGMTLYYLDAFPCYGFGEDARIWLGAKNKSDGAIRIACLYPPREINFAWQFAARDDFQKQTTGLMTCNVSGDGTTLTVDLSKCEKSHAWDEYR